MKREDETTKKIIQACAVCPRTVKQLMDITDLSRRTANRKIKTLREANIIEPKKIVCIRGVTYWALVRVNV